MRRFGPVLLASALALMAADVAAQPAPAAAQRLFDAGKWQQAAIALDGVRRASPSSLDGELAQYRLAIALYHMDLFQAAYAIFGEISSKPNHRAFDDTLPWLAKLATDLPEPADVIERVGKYTQAQISRFDNPRQSELYGQLEYLLGRYQYRNRRYDQALDLFATVDPASKYWVQSQFFSGASNVQLRRSSPALRSFQRVLDAATRGTANVQDAPRMRDLARLSIARMEYSESIRTSDTGEVRIDARALGASIRQWGAIDAASEYWLDGLFEASWAYFMAGDYSHALGNIHTIQAPYFPDSYYPEADVLRAVIYFTQCQYEDATIVVGSFQQKYQPIYGELAKILARFRGDDQQEPFFQFLQRVRHGGSDAGLPRDIEPIVRGGLSDRQLLRNVEYVELLDAEAARFAKLDASFRVSSLGADVSDVLALSRDIAIRRTGALAHERYQRSLDELGEHLRSSARILVEIATQLGPAAPRVGGAHPPTANVVHSDAEHVLWPFREEYWRDELGTYRQTIVSKCPR